MTAPPSTDPAQQAPDAWLDPDCRLIQDGVVHDRVTLLALAADLADQLGGAARIAAVAATPVRVAVALLAARALGAELSLLRGATVPADVDALIDAEGGVTRFSTGGVGAGGVGEGFRLVLETSGTTGVPKRLRHDPGRLAARVQPGRGRGSVWLATFDPGGYAGLQVLLTVLRGGGGLVAGAAHDVPGLAALAVRHGVTHASATPSFWRAFLLTGAQPPLAAITLGGEAADQPLLDRLAQAFPAAAIRHIYASTEAGSLFAVGDGRAGFPAAWLETGVEGTALRIRDGVLQVRGPRQALDLAVDDGWYTTGDRVERVGDRVLFRGREDGVVNVGGVKVRPEAAEDMILGVPGIHDAAVLVQASPITGQLLTARLVAAPGQDVAALRSAVVAALATLPPAARPRRLEFVAELELSPSGKKKRVGA